MSAVLSFLASFLARLFSYETAKYIATRALLYSLFTVVLPAVLLKTFNMIISDILNYASSHLSSADIPSLTIQFTGLAAYLARLLKVPEAFSVIISALSLRAVLNFIPFVK